MTQVSEKYIQVNDQNYISEHSADVRDLLKQSYWAKDREIEKIRKSMENSMCFAIVDKEKDRIVAFARAITDYATMYYLADVIVDEQCRGMGLGKQIVNWITQNESQLEGLYGLLLTKDAQDLYAKYGFHDYENHCMRK